MSYITGTKLYIAPNTFCLTGYLESLVPAASNVLITGSGMQAIAFLMFWAQKKGYTVYHEKTAFVETRVLNHHQREPLDLLDEATEIPQKSMIFLDNPNHRGEWFDVKKLAEKVHAAESLLVVDNSRITLFYDHALEDGADFVVESFSKYGMGTGLIPLGGLYVNAALGIDWLEIVRYAAAFGIAITKEQSEMLVAGLESLPLRMPRHTETATAIHEYLTQAGVEHQYCGKGGLITFPEKYVVTVANMDCVREWGAYGFAFTSWTHCNDAYWFSGRDPDWYVRLSVGLENPEKLLNDIKAAFPMEV